MGKRSGTSATVLAYDQLAMYRIAQSIEANDFTEMAAAIEYLKNNASDNNEAAFNRLISIDFATVDLVTIFFGTNDFTSNENPIGDVNSTDPMTMKGAINIVVNSLLTSTLICVLHLLRRRTVFGTAQHGTIRILFRII